MPKKSAVPDAWDDDWEAQADSLPNDPEPPAAEPAPSTKAERLARHVESNRKLWESASVFPCPSRLRPLQAQKPNR